MIKVSIRGRIGWLGLAVMVSIVVESGKKIVIVIANLFSYNPAYKWSSLTDVTCLLYVIYTDIQNTDKALT